MDFHVSTPRGTELLLQLVDGRVVLPPVPAAPAAGLAPAPPAPAADLPALQSGLEKIMTS